MRITIYDIRIKKEQLVASITIIRDKHYLPQKKYGLFKK